MKLETIFLIGISFAVIFVGIIESRVYETGVVEYWRAGFVEVGLFAIGYIVGGAR